MKYKRNSLRCAVLINMSLMASSHLMAQNTAILSGQVSTSSGKPLVGVNVYINIGSTTDATGHYQITRIPPGEHLVTAEYVGRESKSWQQTFAVGANFTKDISMAIKPLIMPGIVVTASPAGHANRPLTTLSSNVIRRSPARVSGELIRQVPGVDAVRRGPVGLDPVIRGLRETEVGAYIDGCRMFPAGPGRMDSPISHIDPNAIHKIQVVKGPYALTWGAGNLSAIRVETPRPADFSGKPFHATAATGFHSNLNAADATASVLGSSGRFSYWASGTWRQGQDYNSGADQEIPGDFKSKEARGKIGLELTPNSNLTFSAGHQRQDDIDYPGRLLNADFFDASNISGRWQWSRGAGLLRSLDVTGYYNFIDHGMGNPTLKPERSTQVDVWLEATYSKFSFNANLFARKMNNYITLETTGLSPELTLIPPTVFGYINGDANFLGFEAAARYQLTETLSLLTTVKYLRGEDEKLDEPALGIAPFGIDAGFRFDSRSGAFFLESTVHGVARQTRVATTRGEIATDGYLTADILGDVLFPQNVELRAGIVNLLDKSYINHLNAKNPFTGQPLPEPGRVLFTNLSYAF